MFTASHDIISNFLPIAEKSLWVCWNVATTYPSPVHSYGSRFFQCHFLFQCF